jgi:hypothetical protein
MAKVNRIGKQQNAIKRLANRNKVLVAQKEHLAVIMDAVMKTLFHNSDKNALDLEQEILKPLKIDLPKKELEKVWDVITNSGLVSPLIGFGNSGKVELTSEGIKLMSQFGGYLEYMSTQQGSHGLRFQNPDDNQQGQG